MRTERLLSGALLGSFLGPFLINVIGAAAIGTGYRVSFDVGNPAFSRMGPSLDPVDAGRVARHRRRLDPALLRFRRRRGYHATELCQAAVRSPHRRPRTGYESGFTSIFAHLFGEKRTRDFADTVNGSIFRIVATSLLFTSLMMAAALPLIDLVYRRGQFLFSDSQQTAIYFFWVTNGKEANDLRKGNLYRLRKTLVFHFDTEEVQMQMKTLEVEDPIFVTGLGAMKLNTYYELADVAALRTLFGPDFPKDLKKTRPVLQSVGKLAVSFLEAADEFIVALMVERDWTDMKLP